MSSRVVIVAGKGGVGKTTVSAVLARAAAATGRSVLVVAVDGRPGLGALLGAGPLDFDEQVLVAPDGDRGGIRGRTITPDDALVEYLSERGLGRVSRRFVETGAVDLLATTTPGIKDLLVLGKVKQLERAGAADLVVVDAPAAGHALTFLRAARSLRQVVSTGPVRAQADDVLALLGDGRRCQVVLVTLPEETPVNETVETAFGLEEDVGVQLGPVVVNGVVTAVDGLDVTADEAARRAGVELAPGAGAALDEAARMTRRRAAGHAAQVARLAERLPLAQVHLPWVPTAHLDAADVSDLARRLAGSRVGV